MTLLDRYLIKRFLVNFAILFALLYLLASSIDVILQLDDFTSAARRVAGDDAGPIQRTLTMISLVWSFHWPRVFQLYAYLLGLVTVGAMGFTLAQMLRHRELVAILASGTSLYRVAWPICVAAFGLNIVHLVNSNMILPHVAPLLVRSHSEIGASEREAFEINLSPDGRGAMFQSPAYLHRELTMRSPTILELDDQGRTRRRITATSATWDPALRAWRLEQGEAISREDLARGETGQLIRRESIEMYPTDFDPQVIMVRRYGEFAQMLSPRQINELLAIPGAVDVSAIARIKYGRYSIIFINMLLLTITLPFFLLRQPVNLMGQSLQCAAVSLPVMLGAFVLMEYDLPGIPPQVGVFLPVVVMIPLSLAAATLVRT